MVRLTTEVNGLPRGATRHLDWVRGEAAIAQGPNLAILASLTYEAGPIGSEDLGTAKVVRVPSGREVAPLARNGEPVVGDKIRRVEDQIPGTVEHGKAFADELIWIRQEAECCVGRVG